MRPWLWLFVVASLTLSAQTKKHASTPHPQSVTNEENRKVVSTRFELWEKIDDLHRRAGEPGQYYVPMLDKLIAPSEFEHYQSAYKKIYDVFYRDTPVGLVRVLVAYAKDDSRSHLDPDIRVSHVFFIFDKNVVLRDALAAIDEVRVLCAGGCRMNGFAASVIAQPASPSEAQLLLARQMRQQWHDEMPDATPGVQVFYRDSPYPVDFEHSLVERVDLTLVSNASQEKYSLTVRRQEPTMLNVWHPHGQPEVAPQQ